MNEEVFLIGALSQNQYHLLAYKTPAGEFHLPTFTNVEDAKSTFSSFEFLYKRNPKSVMEKAIQNFLEETHLLIFAVPDDVLETMKNRIGPIPEYPKKICWIDFYGNPAILAPLRYGDRFGSKYPIFHLYASILSQNKKLYSPLRKLDIATEDKYDPDHFKLHNLLKNTNAN